MFPNYMFPYINNVSMDNIEKKEWVYENIKQYMYLRLEKMFKYKKLPESVPPEIFNMMLMNGGFAVLTDKVPKHGILAFQGGLGGEPDEYYRPTVCIVSNPALSFDKELVIGTDCALIRNDAFMIGLEPLISRYSALMAENIITMKTVDILLRIIGLISAPDDKTRISAEAYLEKLKNGELAVISENRFFEGVDMKSPPANNGSYMTQFIELHQYYKGSFFNELGLQANFNMKRESIGKGEASLSEDILMPLCESMLQTRRNDFDVFNQMYGENVEVDFDSAWLDNQKEQYYELKKVKAEASQLEEGDELDECNNKGLREDSSAEITTEGTGDAGEEDAGEEDTGEEDAGEEDAGEEDAGEEDAGEEDAGEEDAGEEDTGEEDAGDTGDTADTDAEDSGAGNEGFNKKYEEAAVEVSIEVNSFKVEEQDVEENGGKDSADKDSDSGG